ncbi:hypothetical protein AB1Y20_006881 [Prymnesium parvum]|uniref:Ubiquitin-like domain-containing protein n=1 Tax=Prymnesium parvum TaxID=97485 RepID=A0AB34J1X3_PRYPA
MLLKVQGAGHDVQLTLAEDATILQLKEAIEASTGLVPVYQRLLFRGKTFDEDSALASSVGIADRTKVMLMHSQAYAQDRQAIEAIAALALELDALEARRETVDAAVLDELSTQICCKLDAVEVGDSHALRMRRKAQLKRCEELVQQRGRG